MSKNLLLTLMMLGSSFNAFATSSTPLKTLVSCSDDSNQFIVYQDANKKDIGLVMHRGGVDGNTWFKYFEEEVHLINDYEVPGRSGRYVSRNMEFDLWMLTNHNPKVTCIATQSFVGSSSTWKVFGISKFDEVISNDSLK